MIIVIVVVVCACTSTSTIPQHHHPCSCNACKFASNSIFGSHGCTELPTQPIQFEEIFAMQIICVQTHTGKTIALYVEASDTIDDVKGLINYKENLRTCSS